MRVVMIGAVAILLAACATPSSGGWVRADGSDFTEEQLHNDKIACAPDLPQSGPGSMGAEGFKSCLRMKGWVQKSS